MRLLTLLASDAPVRFVIHLALALEIVGVILNAWALKGLRGLRDTGR